MADRNPAILQPKPRRGYELTPTSSNPSSPASPSQQPNDPSRPGPDSFSEKASRTRSILNLTSSTLFGIYTPSASGIDTNRSEPSTPWENGAQTPAATNLDENKSAYIGAYAAPSSQVVNAQAYPHHHKLSEGILVLAERTFLLFLFGVAYGVVISHLHHSQQVAPVQVDLKGIEHNSWRYLIGWGGVGVMLGGLLPWIDVLWEEVLGYSKDVFTSNASPDPPPSPKPNDDSSGEMAERLASGSGSGLGADWNPVVRSVGAFVGIAFAIRRLPWQSTSQVSLTLALVNPVLWYVVDRSKPGFLLSLLVGLAGTAIAFGVNPQIVPPPAAPSPHAGSTSNISQEYGIHDGLVSIEGIGVGTWIASVLFCSSVCFGNIGRRLALGTASRRSSVS